MTDTHILDDQGGAVINVRTDGKAPTLRAQMGGHPPVVMVLPPTAYGIDHAITTGGNCTAGPVHYVVCRLTPTECARLQGFADWWGVIEPKKDFTGEEYCFWIKIRNTHARINGKKEQEYNGKQMLTWYNKLWTDSSEYKMWGNGIALPTALYCLQGITDALETEEGDDSWML